MKKLLCVLPLAALLCFTLACQDKAEKAELEKFRTQAKLEEQNKEIVRRFFEALDSGSVEKALSVADETFVPDIITHTAARDWQGIERLKNAVKVDYGAFADYRHPIERMTAESDIVVAQLTWKGKHIGIYMGIPATGRQISFPLVYIFRFEGGKIREQWVDFDSLLVGMTQLGMELKPKEAEKK